MYVECSLSHMRCIFLRMKMKQKLTKTITPLLATTSVDLMIDRLIDTFVLKEYVNIHALLTICE